MPGNYKKGITALELLFVMAILIMIIALGLGVFSNFRENSQLISTHSTVIGMLSDARAKTLASDNRIEYGVHFEEFQTVLFKGNTFDPMDPENDAYLLPGLVRISSINLTGGVDDVFFQRLTGAASATGTIVFEALNDATKNKIISIISSGSSN
jgi:Tfp pilus assembly protein FimT